MPAASSAGAGAGAAKAFAADPIRFAFPAPGTSDALLLPGVDPADIRVRPDTLEVRQ